MADVDLALEQHILSIPQKQREAEAHHHRQQTRPGDELK
jgi:hypothetical protein